METGVIILVLVGVIALISYKKGKQEALEKVLKDEIQSNKERDVIRRMSDGELDDELSEYWE